MSTILLLGSGAVLACVGIAAWKIYGPPKPASAAQLPASEHNGKNWVASDFTPPADSASASSINPTDAADSGA